MKLGLVIHSWWKRWRGKFASAKYPPFTDALEVLAYTKQLGAAGLQIGVDSWTDDFAGKVRVLRQQLELYLEGSVALPREPEEVPHFEETLRRAKEAGATIFRTALGGRRYEQFKAHAAFLDFKTKAEKALQLAAPVVEKAGVKLGVENHKDFHAVELADMLKKLGSASVGACIDTGNNIALLEEPFSVVETLAPMAVTVHLKDMAVLPGRNGFYLSEVPLGQGMLDIQGMVDTIRAANPTASINLEMITRDPLAIDCLTPSYWATFPDKTADQLAMALASVKHYASPELPSMADLELEQVLERENQNILESLRYARGNLSL